MLGMEFVYNFLESFHVLLFRWFHFVAGMCTFLEVYHSALQPLLKVHSCSYEGRESDAGPGHASGLCCVIQGV